jgi:hypothetical protein
MVVEDKDEPPHVNVDETDEEVQDTCLAIDDDLDSDITIEEGDCVFMMMVHLVDPQHFVCASSTVFGHLAEAFAKNLKLKDFHDIVLTSLHAYANIFSETVFDSLPERCKLDHAIELECGPSPRFRKVYPMTLMEQTEMDTSDSPNHPLEPRSSSSTRKMENFALSRTTEPSMPLPGRIVICSH